MSDAKITYNEYWRQVKAIAKEAKAETKEKGSSREAWQERAQESARQTVDGHQWIIYTAYTPWVLMHSPSHDAWFESYGASEFDGYSDVMTKLAFAALEQDVMEELNSLF
jgi:hypothetical protein